MFHLQRNLPAWERLLRVCAGIAIAAVAWQQLPAGGLLWALLVAAATSVATAVVGFCPACALVGRRPLGRQR
jgi:hypothetical protein